MAGRDPATGANRRPPLQLVRLAVPRRADVTAGPLSQARSIRGLRITYEAPVLRHFTARFEHV